MKRYRFKYKGVLYHVLETELPEGLGGFRKDKKGVHILGINKSLSDFDKSMVLHRLIKNRGLRKFKRSING
ncbi:hypothetical protein [Caproiciproducens sp. MSJ-32]|uniref:hypothetical protein n=1 Tax=Caproiciproducens sp. MSJ-32 TaxID=2841527 RepID=UPI001C0F8A94|nr:hypothetical protein [Caproiciproducens sp. MSJ-32]MBU5454541.1 hypothetical protein [Caproiciproducens sp. MSJ-32]